MIRLVWRLALVVSFHLKKGFIILVAGLHELGVFLEIAALRGNIVADIAD